ncbi:MAG: DUF4012 domain-containing protein [Candidatus Gottesmanbacteria bacterium]
MDDDIPKINLETPVVKEQPKIIDTKAVLPRTRRFPIKLLISILIGIAIIFIIIGVLIALPAKNIYSQTLTTYKIAKEVYDAIKKQDIPKAEEKIKETRTQLLSTQKSYQALAWTGYVPFVGNYWKDGDHLIKAGLAALDAGEIAIEGIIPYTDLLGLKGKSTFVSKSTDERIQTAVATLDKIIPKLGEISPKIEIVKKEISSIDPNRYPEKFRQFTPRSQISNFKTMTNDITTMFISAKPLLEVTPKLLGSDSPKRYFIIFQNDKELRPTGGFMTAYAIFNVDKGKMKVEVADDIYKLGSGYSSTIQPPKPFIDHLKVYKLYIRDTNFDPDFVTSMKQFETFYKSVGGNPEKLDGIIAVDTHVLVEAMKILGAIPAYGTNFTAEPDKRCDGCPQVIYELEAITGERVGYIRENRKDIIGVLMYQIMQKALGVSPGQYWGKLVQMGISEIQQKHILMYMHDLQAQKGIEAFNMGGRIRETTGDYLHVNNANLGGAKSNMFVTQTVKQEYQTQSDGSITATLTINYKNPAAESPGCNLELGGICLNGPMPNWLRVYVPKGSQLVEMKGSEDKPITSEASGKTVFEGFLTVKPLGTAQVMVKYKLPFKQDKNKPYNLLIQKQPGTDNNEYNIFVNGKQVDKFPLTTDKELKLTF